MEETRQKWHVELIRSVNGLAEDVGLDDLGASRMREFVLSIAKSQYMAGNRAGIYWARNGKNKATTV
ncbi:hypothetical protein A2348_03440 [Candidatus Uhrbacteria bacterium RIFOXYB12_FULL_58_10]|uniref:Uncharacterized protein n=1 Tax=Candidatus Uhrbacteria bacterium RIFOXYB2_FULL_57_15 TaxID=1802422 RepID=A0A1F7W5T5_9BACT|nr:MAG: hypothetical protein A2348_03440 [Candidatus Uhrbacteria bacterium RIFOXYB12_FULL_58_10]OGL98119.1 MAG: hypothetical protein A2304_03490 [Candidatus Uhrbacteria bacterium RIFOXYB2_FULL_57_15]OGM00103.1 MAG: hypothetical protein A2501_01145 [Candidatus Uhrbacteria bacterium RIFOXYC12_FULL_57_11]